MITCFLFIFFIEDIPHANGWLVPPGSGGPPLPCDVKIELQNKRLWQQFHKETTEMIITKLGRSVPINELFTIQIPI